MQSFFKGDDSKLGFKREKEAPDAKWKERGRDKT
jgi:hypothetical protein